MCPQRNEAKNRLMWTLKEQRIKEAAHYAWGELLDVGCGTRPYEKHFVPYVRRYVGMDVQDARYEEHRSALDVKVDVHGDAEHLPFEDGAFDTLVAFQLLEHLPHPWRFFEEAARVLSPGGVLILSTNQQWHEHDAPDDYYRFTQYGLRSLATDVGLSTCAQWNVGGGMLMMGTALNYWLARYEHTRLKGCLASVLMALTNLIVPVAERLFPWAANTAEWVMVANKPSGCASKE